MADYAGENVAGFAGSVLTERSGTASADTVPAGAMVVWRNTGAGAHNVTLTTNNTYNGLAIADQVIPFTAGQVKGARVPLDWGDANGRVQVAIDGTATEVKYYVLGGV